MKNNDFKSWFGLIMVSNLIPASLLLAISVYSHATCNPNIIPTATDNRYQLVNDGSEVKDVQTGLIWQRCSLGQTWNGTSCTGTASMYNWPNALQAAANTGSGWRIPDMKELASLVEEACYNPSINITYFPNAQKDWYWSSSPVNNGAWSVYFFEGQDHFNSYYSYQYVRLVR